MDITDGLAIPMRTMRAVDLPHQGLLDVTDLCGDNLQLVVRDIAALAAEVHHHDVPPLIPIVLPPVPLKLLEGLLSVVDADGEVVQSLTVTIVELVDPLDMTLQVLDSFLNLNDGDVQGAMVDLLVFESGLDRKHLFLELLDTNILVSEFLSLWPVLVGQTTHSSLETFSLSMLNRDVMGHLCHLLLQG